MSRKLLSILLFTLHRSSVNRCAKGACTGEELLQLFTTLHPLFTLIFFEDARFSLESGFGLRPSMVTSFGLQWWPASVFNGDQLRSSIVAGLGMRWRVVKSGEELSQLFTSQNPSVYRGFRRFGEEWRVNARVVFFSQLLSPSSSFSFLLLLLLPPDVSFLAWQWQEIALARGNIVP